MPDRRSNKKKIKEDRKGLNILVSSKGADTIKKKVGRYLLRTKDPSKKKKKKKNNKAEL
jgi:hypothetical protein